jgi:hypothetical protein
MGFKRAYYVPNGVNEDLFKPIKPIRKEGDWLSVMLGKNVQQKDKENLYYLPFKLLDVKVLLI